MISDVPMRVIVHLSRMWVSDEGGVRHNGSMCRVQIHVIFCTSLRVRTTGVERPCLLTAVWINRTSLTYLTNNLLAEHFVWADHHSTASLNTDSTCVCMMKGCFTILLTGTLTVCRNFAVLFAEPDFFSIRCPYTQ